jgi:hypothetical protein
MNDKQNETETEISQEVREAIRAEIYKDLSKKGNAARRGTLKARKHAALIGLKGALARRRNGGRPRRPPGNDYGSPITGPL